MPGRCRAHVAGRARSRPAAGGLLPCRLHPACRGRRHRPPQQGGSLRPAVPRSVRDDVDDRCRPRHLGARIGITAVLHTWGSAPTHHPHVHMIVPGGGIALDGERWISSRPAFLLPVRVLGKLFRRLFLTRLIALYDAGRLAFFGGLAPLADRRAFLRHLVAGQEETLGGLCQAAVRRSRSRARLSLALHPPRRHLEPAAARFRRDRRHASATRTMCAVKAREVEYDVVTTSQALLIFDRRLQCRPPV